MRSLSFFPPFFSRWAGVACGRVHCAGRGRWRASALASSRHTTRSSLQRACPNRHGRGGSGAGRHAHKKKERKKGIGPCGPDNSPRHSKRRLPPGGSGGRALRGSASLPMMWMPVARHPGENPIEKARPCVRGRGGSRPSGPIPGGRGARARLGTQTSLTPLLRRPLFLSLAARRAPSSGTPTSTTPSSSRRAPATGWPRRPPTASSARGTKKKNRRPPPPPPPPIIGQEPSSRLLCPPHPTRPALLCPDYLPPPPPLKCHARPPSLFSMELGGRECFI